VNAWHGNGSRDIHNLVSISDTATPLCTVRSDTSVVCCQLVSYGLVKDKELSRHVAHQWQKLFWVRRTSGSRPHLPWSLDQQRTDPCIAKLWNTDRCHHRLTKRCSRTQQTFSCNLLLLDGGRHVHLVILWVYWGGHKSVSSRERIVKIGQDLTKLSQKFRSTLFMGHIVYIRCEIRLVMP
jgi:hypothetical protein